MVMVGGFVFFLDASILLIAFLFSGLFARSTRTIGPLNQHAIKFFSRLTTRDASVRQAMETNGELKPLVHAANSGTYIQAVL